MRSHGRCFSRCEASQESRAGRWPGGDARSAPHPVVGRAATLTRFTPHKLRHSRAGVLFNPCPGCHTASAGFGAEPQEKGEALDVSSFVGREREGFWMENSQ